jgi:hypothetical protein
MAFQTSRDGHDAQFRAAGFPDHFNFNLLNPTGFSV